MNRNTAVLTTILLMCCGVLLFAGCEVDSRSSSVQLSDECLADLDTLTTSDGVEYVRTPDGCFEELPDWEYEPQYVEIDGLRQAYVDVGPADADPILLLHGQPSWSYLYRYMIPTLADEGHRVIAMDHLGMGRSDKPLDMEYHSFGNHVNRLDAFIQELELENITLFAQDWGSVIGLYLASENLNLFDRMVIGNGGLPIVEEVIELPENIDASVADFHRTLEMIPAQQPLFYDEDGNSRLPGGSEIDVGFGQWIAYAMYYEDFRASNMVEALTFEPLTPEEKAAYDAPFPTEITMAGARSFPSLLNDMVGLTEAAEERLATYEKPFLTIFGGNEPGLGGPNDPQDRMIDLIPGSAGQPHHRFPDASHFLQDDKGAEVAEMVNQFIADNPR